MRKLNLLFLAVLFCSCSKIDSKADIQGIWYTADPTLADRHYSEAHITDTSLVVINDVSLSYLSSYELKTDTLIQYVKDTYNTNRIIDTLKFIVVVTPDSLKIVNAVNRNHLSTWTRIPDLEPVNFSNVESVDPFLRDFRDRYKNNYLEIYKPNSVDANLKDFDGSWNRN